MIRHSSAIVSRLAVSSPGRRLGLLEVCRSTAQDEADDEYLGRDDAGEQRAEVEVGEGTLVIQPLEQDHADGNRQGQDEQHGLPRKNLVILREWQVRASGGRELNGTAHQRSLSRSAVSVTLVQAAVDGECGE
jgi:hypothetical protein